MPEKNLEKRDITTEGGGMQGGFAVVPGIYGGSCCEENCDGVAESIRDRAEERAVSVAGGRASEVGIFPKHSLQFGNLAMAGMTRELVSFLLLGPSLDEPKTSEADSAAEDEQCCDPR